MSRSFRRNENRAISKKKEEKCAWKHFCGGCLVAQERIHPPLPAFFCVVCRGVAARDCGRGGAVFWRERLACRIPRPTSFRLGIWPVRAVAHRNTENEDLHFEDEIQLEGGILDSPCVKRAPAFRPAVFRPAVSSRQGALNRPLRPRPPRVNNTRAMIHASNDCLVPPLICEQ